MPRVRRILLAVIGTIGMGAAIVRAQPMPQEAAVLGFAEPCTTVDGLNTDATAGPTTQAAAVTAASCDANGLSSLSPRRLGWLVDATAYPTLADGNLSALGNGFVEAPQSGQTTFSISPINVNADKHPTYIRQNVFWRVNCVVSCSTYSSLPAFAGDRLVGVHRSGAMMGNLLRHRFGASFLSGLLYTPTPSGQSLFFQEFDHAQLK